LTVIHVNHGTHPTILEDEITVGHRAILHGCHIRERSLIGMGAVVMDDAEVGPESIVAAGSLVSPGTRVPNGTLVRGIPARVVRSLSREEVAAISESVADYVKLKNIYLKGRSSNELAR
jgi:carbonic anhydrase/acetyltransferase-like protein (isoleucine patch superfamily)